MSSLSCTCSNIQFNGLDFSCVIGFRNPHFRFVRIDKMRNWAYTRTNQISRSQNETMLLTSPSLSVCLLVIAKYLWFHFRMGSQNKQTLCRADAVLVVGTRKWVMGGYMPWIWALNYTFVTYVCLCRWWWLTCEMV